MADGDSGGILGEIGQALTNPEMEMLLPAVMGAGGGALTAPIMSGRRGALGGALQGGGQGLAAGMGLAQKQKMDQAQLAEMQQHTQNMQLQNKQLTAAIGNDEAFKAESMKLADQLPPGDKDQFLALATKDPAGALKFYNQNNGQTRNLDANLISSVFGGDPGQYAGMDADTRAAYRGAALRVKEQSKNGQAIAGAQGYYMVRQDPRDPSKVISIPVLDDKGQPLKPLAPVVAGINAGARIEAANIGAGSREDVANINQTGANQRTDKNIKSRENIAGENIASREHIAGENIASREGIAGENIAARKYNTDMASYNKRHSDWMKDYGALQVIPADQRPPGIPPEPQPPPPLDPSEAAKYTGMAPKSPAAGSSPTAPAPAATPAASPVSGATAPASSPSSASSAGVPEGPKPTESKSPSKGGVPAKKEESKFPPTVNDSKLGVMKYVRTDPDGRGVYKAPDGKEYHANPAKSGS